MMRRKRIVITGMGVVSPIGNTVQEFTDSLQKGISGIDYITKFDTSNSRVKVAGEVKGLHFPEHINERRLIQRSHLFSQYALHATYQALCDAGIPLSEHKLDDSLIDPYRVSALIGTGLGGEDRIVFDAKRLEDNEKISSFSIPSIMQSSAAANASIQYKLHGESQAPNAACASSQQALGDAIARICMGWIDIALVGGSDAPISPISIAGFDALGREGALSTKKYDQPSQSSRPFDEGRDGFVMGEGAGVIVVESLEHALRREATILAEAVGYGGASDAHNIVAPDMKAMGATKAMHNAITDAGIKPIMINALYAHGTSTPFNDPMEYKALENVFAEYVKTLPVTAIKSMTGHPIGAASVMQAIAAIVGMNNGYIPPTINYETIDPKCPANVSAKKRDIDQEYVLSNSFAFGGVNTSVVFKKWNG